MQRTMKAAIYRGIEKIALEEVEIPKVPPNWVLVDTKATGICGSDLKTYYGDEFEYSYGLATPAHLIQAAIAHYRATNERKFLECAMKVAEKICQTFRHSGPESLL